MSILAAVVFLSGCSGSGETPAATEVGGTAPDKKQEAAGVIGSLKDAIGLGKKMECVSQDANGETKVYIDGTKYKSTSVVPEGNMVMVFDGQDFRIWNEKTKQGFIMTKVCMEELNKNMPEADGPGNLPKNDNFQSTEDVVAEESLDNCKETGPIDFTVPADVEFIDQCELMKNIPAGIKDLQIPAGR